MIKLGLRKTENYTLRSKMDFGKYRGKSLAWVLCHNPIYLEYCLKNRADFRVSSRLESRIKDEAEYTWYDRYEGMGWGDWDDIF